MYRLFRTAWMLTALCAAFVMLAALAGGVQPPARLPGLIDPACSMPCWQGIRPGETSVNRAYTLMSLSPFVDTQTLRFLTAKNNELQAIRWSAMPRAGLSTPLYGDFQGSVSVEDGTIKKISLELYRTQTTLGDVMGLLGVPSGVAVRNIHTHQDHMYPAGVEIHYPEQNVLIYGVLSPSIPAPLWTIMRVHQIHFYTSPSPLDDNPDMGPWLGSASRNYMEPPP